MANRLGVNELLQLFKERLVEISAYGSPEYWGILHLDSPGNWRTSNHARVISFHEKEVKKICFKQDETGYVSVVITVPKGTKMNTRRKSLEAK